ncbi:MAG TPA: hypothetical protein PKE30_00375 [Niabella sp.]|nr:hypothetical protein [Niabella sp.]
MKKWKEYIFQFILIFVSVFLAFFLTEWSLSQDDKISENKILTEIDNGINSDLEDFESNINGHTLSLRAISVIRNWIDGKFVPQDSIGLYYNILFRNFTPIINKSGYESLKFTNLKTITNDSLRFQIINLYEYYYKILEKLEDNVIEMQDFENFYVLTNTILNPYFEFDETGRLVKLIIPHNLTKAQKQELLSYLWKLENNKKFKIFRYNNVIEEIKKTDKNIKRELNKS